MELLELSLDELLVPSELDELWDDMELEELELDVLDIESPSTWNEDHPAQK